MPKTLKESMANKELQASASRGVVCPFSIFELDEYFAGMSPRAEAIRRHLEEDSCPLCLARQEANEEDKENQRATTERFLAWIRKEKANGYPETKAALQQQLKEGTIRLEQLSPWKQRLVNDAVKEPSLVRLYRQVKEGVEEELWRLVAGARGGLDAIGPWQLAFAPVGSTSLLGAEIAAGTFSLIVPLIPGATPEAKPELRLVLVFQVKEKDRFDLKATAIAPSLEVSVAGIRLTFEIPAMEKLLTLESGEDGTFSRHEAPDEVFLTNLPFSSYRLRVKVPQAPEEFILEIPDVLGLCRKAPASSEKPRS